MRAKSIASAMRTRLISRIPCAALLRVNHGAASRRQRHRSFPKAHTIAALDHGPPRSKPSLHMPMHQQQKRRLTVKLSQLGTLQAAIRQYGSVGRCCNMTGLLVVDVAQVSL
jgi:hypothetical protein